jgi:CRP/FNR family transcriptional regulator, dissimilatory nitrate respiration regulator
MNLAPRVSQDLSRSADSTERLLARLPLFAGLGDAEVRRLARFATEFGVPRGAVVFRQGEFCGGLHFVIEGQIKLAVQSARGDEKVIDLVGPGASFGETALFLGEPHRVLAEAIVDSVLVQLGRDAVLEEMQRNAGFSGRVLQAVCRRLVQRTHDLESFTLHSGTQRVIAYLLSQLPNPVNGAPIAIRLPVKKSIIASRLNITQEHFSRILHDIQAAGAIEVRGREIQILDAGRLRTNTS